MTATEEKTLLRRRLIEKRDAMSEEKRAACSQAVCERIAALDIFKRAEKILLYYRHGSEIDLLPLAADSLSAGKEIYYPVADKATHRMVFLRVTDIKCGFTRGAYGIFEPAEGSARLDETHNALCVVPALAVTADGLRIGYGGGYYDRFLAGFRGESVAAVFPGFILDSLPADRYDRRVGTVILGII